MDNVLLSLQTILQTALGSSYTVVYGDDATPKKSDLPFVAIDPRSTLFSANGTGGLREVRHVIDIVAKVTIKDYMQDNTDITIQCYLQDLIKIMEERNANWTPKNTTILGALSNDLSLGGVVHTMEMGTVQYGAREEGGSYIRTATLTIETISQIPGCNS